MTRHSPPSVSNQAYKLLLFGLVVSFLIIFWALSPELWDKYSVPEDMQNFYWMARYQEPTLLVPDNLPQSRDIIEFNILGAPVILYPLSVGYGFLFYIASFVIDYIWLSKWLVFVLMPLCVVFLFKLGVRVDNRIAGFSLSILFAFFMMASYQSISIASGLQRGFAIPLLILFLYSMICRKYVATAVIILASALLFMPNFPLTALTYSLAMVIFRRPFKISLDLQPGKFLPFMVACLLSGLAAGLALASQQGVFASNPPPVPITTLTNEKSISQDPFFQGDGVVPLYFGSPLLGQVGLLDAGTDVINFLVLLLLSGLIYAVLGRPSLRKMPVVCWHLLLASFLLYLLALYFVFGLSSQAIYWPSRYTRSTLFLVSLYFVGLNWPTFWANAPAWFKKNGRWFTGVAFSMGVGLAAAYALSATRPFVWPVLWLGGLIISGVLTVFAGSILFEQLMNWRSLVANRANIVRVLVASVVVLILGTFYLRSLSLVPINSSPAQRQVYEFVSTLPKDALLAGDPDTMSGIPLFSKRRVLFRGLFPDAQDPIVEFFDAQYAETSQTMLDFCRRYGVTHLVLNTHTFDTAYLAKKDFFYQPWNDEIVNVVANRSDFVLPKLQPVYSAGLYRVIECDAETLLASH